MSSRLVCYENALCLAALLEGTGRVWAFDMDPRRLTRLEANAAAAGAGNVVATQADFLQVDVQDEQYLQARGLRQAPGIMLLVPCAAFHARSG